MKEFSVPMALMDYIPVILFYLGTSTVAKDVRHRMTDSAQGRTGVHAVK